MPDFIALRGDPSDKIPGAPGVGPKKAADVLKQHGSLAQALADGRFPQIADDLLLYREIATMDADAPLPKLGADAARLGRRRRRTREELGLGGLAPKLAARGLAPHEPAARRSPTATSRAARASGSCVATRQAVPALRPPRERRPDELGRAAVLVRRRLVDEQQPRPSTSARATATRCCWPIEISAG